MKDTSLTSSILAFLDKIGIPNQPKILDETCVLPGVLIDKGILYYDLSRLENPGDLIHEAGHIALMTQDERNKIVGNVKEYRSPAEDDELGVLAWSYAASKYLDLKPEVIFHENGYHGQSSQLVHGYATGQNLGLPLLVWMNLCDYETYPAMKKWVRE